jgi:hypothetical protein
VPEVGRRGISDVCCCRHTPDAFGTQAIDRIKIRMLLDQPLERGVGQVRGIEPGSLAARAIGAAAAQRVEAIACVATIRLTKFTQ